VEHDLSRKPVSTRDQVRSRLFRDHALMFFHRRHTKSRVQEARSPPAAGTHPSPGFASGFVTAQDGLTLHVRRYGSRRASVHSVVCLPGLGRTAADFHPLATALAADPTEPRYVLAPDYRGHGQSKYDRDPANYTVRVALADLSAVLTALEAAPAILVGTSFGGVLAMMLAVLRPTAIAGVILNDIGPVIEPPGLLRIKSYVGKLPTLRTFDEGAEILRWRFEAQFTKLAPQDWIAFARRTWREHRGRLVPDHDPRIARALQEVSLEQRLPTLWEQFDALAHVPLMVIRGHNSDMLAPTTVNAMLSRRGQLEVVVVPDQGHAPLLAEPKVISRIAAFAASCDVSARP
jgi:pimeloyl-ACP methyl ester carboxylesterase